MCHSDLLQDTSTKITCMGKVLSAMNMRIPGVLEWNDHCQNIICDAIIHLRHTFWTQCLFKLSNFDLLVTSLNVMLAVFRDKRIYWTDVTNRRIESMNFDKTNRKVLHNREIPNGEGLAVEWVSRKLYWVRMKMLLILWRLYSPNRKCPEVLRMQQTETCLSIQPIWIIWVTLV